MLNRHSKVRLASHFVWATQERLPLIVPEIERRLYRYVTTVCQRDGCDVLAIGGTENHIHLLVYLGHDISISGLMHHVKGGSSRFLGKILGEQAFFAWQRGYAVFGVSPHDKPRVVAYICNQKQHHADGTLWAGAEDLADDTDDGEDPMDSRH